MNKDVVDIIMNPIRQRVAQYLIVNGEGTVSQIAAGIPDVSRTTLYRHINILREAGLLTVSGEKSVRGATEKTYTLMNPNPENVTREDVANMINSMLMSLMASFSAYFKDEKNDFLRDMLSLTTSTLLMSDSELKEFSLSLGQVFNKYVANEPNAERKPRSITFIVSPVVNSVGGKNNA